MSVDPSPPTRPARNHTNDVLIMVLVAVAAYFLAGQFVGSFWYVIWLMCAAGSAAIAQGKGLSPVHGFVVGILLGPIGLLIAVFQRSAAPAAAGTAVPQGVVIGQPSPVMAANCPNCHNANQVPATAPQFACGHCGTVVNRM